MRGNATWLLFCKNATAALSTRPHVSQIRDICNSRINLQVWYLVVFCVDTCLCIFRTKQLLIVYDHGKIENECKCSCSAGVESVDSVTVLGKLQDDMLNWKQASFRRSN